MSVPTNLIDAQQCAIDAIVALRPMAKPLPFCRHKRLPRSVRPIYRRFEAYAQSVGCTAQQISRQWSDIIDMVVLADNAEDFDYRDKWENAARENLY